MADNAQIEFHITSNTDKLSDRVLHDTFVNFVRNEALMGEVALKAIVPKGESLSLMREAGHKGPYDEGFEITSYVGIPEIHKSADTDPMAAKYPIFVDKGTGIFGDTESPIFPKTKGFMKLPPKDGYSIFHRSVKGQEGQGFMAATFSTMIGMLKVNGEAWKAELTKRFQSDKLT